MINSWWYRFVYPRSYRARWVLLAGAFGVYILVFLLNEDWMGPGAIAFSILPVLAGGWYFGILGGLLTTAVGLALGAILCILAGFTNWYEIIVHGGLMGALILALVSVAVGRLGKALRQQQHELAQREQTTLERQFHADFLILLNDIASKALQSENLAAMLEVLAARVGELFGADDCHITRWDEINQATVPLATYGSTKGTYQNIRFGPEERTLTSSVLRAGRALAIEDVRNSPYVSPNMLARFSNVSWLGLPLSAGDRKLGAIILGFNTPHHFSEEEIARGEFAARQISLTMAKVQLLDITQRQAKQQSALFHLSTTLAETLTESEIYQHVVQGLQSYLGYDNIGLFMVDETTRERVLQASAGWADAPSDWHIPPGQGVSEYPLLNGRLHYTPDVSQDPRYVPGVGGCEVDVPVRVGEKVKGVLAVENKQPHSFTRDDFNVLSAAANLIGWALTRVRSARVERRQLEELSALHAVAVAGAEAKSTDELIERVTQIIGQSLYPDNFGILLLDEKAGVLRIHPSYRFMNKDMTEVPEIPMGRGVSGRVAKDGKAVCIPDVTSIPEYLNVDAQARSELCVPLKVGEHVIGVINVESSKLDAFTPDDMRLLTTLAGQLATAIERLRIAEAEYRWVVETARSSALVGVLADVAVRIEMVSEPDSVMQILGSELRQLGLTSLIALFVPGTQNLAIRYTSLDPDTMRKFERLSGRKKENWLIPAEQLLPVIDLIGQPRPMMLANPIETIITVLGGCPRPVVERILRLSRLTNEMLIGHFPLVVKEKVLGLLWLWGTGLQEADLKPMSVFASQVAIAIENARLFSEIRHMAITDELTGLHNRRHFFDLAFVEFYRSRRYGRPFAILMLDIDHFKRVNDRHGHTAGDQVLHSMAKLCLGRLREVDIFARYGGEEFVAMLVETGTGEAQQVAERLRQAVAEATFAFSSGDVHITISIGVAADDEGTLNLLEVIERSDQAMYAAKQAGRNRVAVYS